MNYLLVFGHALGPGCVPFVVSQHPLNTLIALNELSLNEHPGTGLGAGNTKKMVTHSLPFVMTWLFGCLIVAQGRRQICPGERVYFISILSKQRSQGGRDVRQLAQSQAWLRAEWAPACIWVSSLSPLLRSLVNSGTHFNEDTQDNPLQTRQQASLS